MTDQGWQELARIADGRPLVIERVRIEGAGVAVEGQFALPELAKLLPEDQVFVAAFVRSHGSIKDMERLFGVSYPTVKARLNRIGAQLSFAEIDPPPARTDILERLERGEINAAEAVAALKSARGNGGGEP